MNKILKNLISVIIISGGLSSCITDSHCEYQLQKEFFSLKNEAITSNIHTNLHYNCSQQEAKNDPNFKGQWYWFVKKSFNLIKDMNKDDKIFTEFCNSTKNDKELIKLVKSILTKNNAIYNFIDMCYHDCNDGLSCDYRLECVDDIIHNNIYAVVLDKIIKEYNENEIHGNKQAKLLLTKSNEKNYRSDVRSIIQKIASKIQNPIRRNIVQNALLHYYEHNVPDAINWNNYIQNCVRISGMQNDIYGNYTNHIACSGLSVSSFLQMLLSNTEGNIENKIAEFNKLITEGYITNPEIVKLFGIYSEMKTFEEFSLDILNTKPFLEKIYQEFGDEKNILTEIDKSLGSELIDRIKKVLSTWNNWIDTYQIFDIKSIRPYIIKIIDENVKKIRETSKEHKKLCK